MLTAPPDPALRSSPHQQTATVQEPLTIRIVARQVDISRGPYGCAVIARWGRRTLIRAYKLTLADRLPGENQAKLRRRLRLMASESAVVFALGVAATAGPPSSIAVNIDRHHDEGERLALDLSRELSSNTYIPIDSRSDLPVAPFQRLADALEKPTWSADLVEAAIAFDLGWAASVAHANNANAGGVDTAPAVDLSAPPNDAGEAIRIIEHLRGHPTATWFMEWIRLRAFARALAAEDPRPIEGGHPDAAAPALRFLTEHAACMALLDAPTDITPDTALELASDADPAIGRAEGSPAGIPLLLHALNMDKRRAQFIAAAFPNHPAVAPQTE